MVLTGRCLAKWLNWNMSVLASFIQEWMDLDWISWNVVKGQDLCSLRGCSGHGWSPHLPFWHGFASRMFFSGQWMMLLKRGSSRDSGWGCRLCVGAWGEVWELRASLCSAPAALCLWRERTLTGGYPAGLFNFYFCGSPHRIVVRLKCRGWRKKKNLKLFAGQENISHPALKGLPREIFFCLYFSLMSQAPKNVLFHIQSDILTYICLTIWHTYWF